MQKFISGMSKMYPLFIAIGVMVVLASVVIGYQNSQAAAEYFAQPKVIRETTLMAGRAAIMSTGLWLPYLKFLGLGLILSGIVMALRVIIDDLQGAGNKVMSNLPEGKRPSPPSAPWYGILMPITMMMGLLIFIAALVVSLDLANIASAVFSNPIPDIDAAVAGSVLLAQVETIHATTAWLVPLKFFGISTEFLAIVMGLSTIIYILSNQTKMIGKGIGVARTLGRQPEKVQKDTRDKVFA